MLGRWSSLLSLHLCSRIFALVMMETSCLQSRCVMFAELRMDMLRQPGWAKGTWSCGVNWTTGARMGACLAAFGDASDEATQPALETVTRYAWRYTMEEQKLLALH